MKITQISKKIFVITDKHSTYVKTPYGKLPADSHEAGIQAARDYLANR